MNRSLAIARRDFASYFLTPTGYIVTAMFLLVTGILFVAGFQQGEISTLRPVFSFGTWLLLFIGPAITMRMISEESRSGTMEALMTSPVSETEIILGKYAAALMFMLVMLIPTLIYLIALEMYGRPDYGEMLCGYAGVLLAGSAYIACGLFASTLSSSQPVAFLVALFFWLVLGIGSKLLPAKLPELWSSLVVTIDPDYRLNDFAIGLIDTSNIVYFVSLSAIFILAAIKSLESRRWR